MPFVVTSVGKFQYLGADFLEVECGGGGNCLFLSLAWLLNRALHPMVPQTHATVRATASNTLVLWANGTAPVVQVLHDGSPVDPNFYRPTLAQAQAVAADRFWGELASVIAVVEALRSAGAYVTVHVLGPDANTVHVVQPAGAPADAPVHAIHLHFESFVHYRALVLADQVATLAPNMVVANFAMGFRRGWAKSALAASLQSKAQPSKTTTLSTQSASTLEIHHIDVGQGEATLFFIKDDKDDIQLSMLVDAGERQGQVTAYFDKLIAQGNFRPLDLFVASHPDKDHIGDVKGVLDSLKYTSSNVILYDGGRPPKCDREYLDVYLQTAPAKAERRKRPRVNGFLLKDFLGVTIRCLACNGVMANGYDPDASKYWQHQGIGRGISLTSDDYTREGELQLAEAAYPTDKNDYSIALHLSFGHFSYFTAGDLSASYEEDIAHYVNLVHGPVSVWKAGHHGSQHSSTAPAVGWLQGRLCVLSFGTNNTFGHPHRAVIEHLEGLNQSGVRCEYLGTGRATALASNSMAGEFGKNGVDDLGTIIVRARGAVVAKQESFDVSTDKSGPWITLDAETTKVRRQDSQALVAVSTYFGAPSRPLSEDSKRAKRRRKEQRDQDRLKEARTLLRDSIQSEGYSLDVLDTLLKTDGNERCFEQQVALLAQKDLDSILGVGAIRQATRSVIAQLKLTKGPG